MDKFERSNGGRKPLFTPTGRLRKTLMKMHPRNPDLIRGNFWQEDPNAPNYIPRPSETEIEGEAVCDADATIENATQKRRILRKRLISNCPRRASSQGINLSQEQTAEPKKLIPRAVLIRKQDEDEGRKQSTKVGLFY